MLAFSDQVEEWKRDALANLGLSGTGRRATLGLTLHVKLGFVLVVMVAGAPFGVVGWAVTLVTLLSVLFVAELPSVLAGYLANRTTRVVFSATGGDTELGGPPFSANKTMALSACGSLCNFAAALALQRSVQNGLVGGGASLVAGAATVHVLWGIAQLLPLMPFRWGRAIARRLGPTWRVTYTALCFVVVGVLGLSLLRRPDAHVYFSFFVLATIGSASAFRDVFDDLRDDQAGVPVLSATAAAHLREDQAEQAAGLARRALASASLEGNRAPLLKTLAWAAIAKRDPFTAHGAVAELRAGARDLHLVAAYLACCNRNAEAIRLLQEARHHGHRARETTKLLIDLLFHSGRRSEALAIVDADAALLDPDDVVAVESAFGGDGAVPRGHEASSH